MTIKKIKHFDLKRKRLRVLEIGVILSLALLILAFKYTPSIDEPVAKSIGCSFGDINDNAIIVCGIPIPETQPKTKCPVPIITISNDDICDIELCSTELDITAAVNNPLTPLYDSLVQEKDDTIIWFDTPEQETLFSTPELERPRPIGGLVGIQKRVVYPLTEKEKGIEGRVILRAYIDEHGNVYKIDVMRSLTLEFDEAAKKAVKETKFIPTKNKGKAIKSTIAIPIMFKLD